MSKRFIWDEGDITVTKAKGNPPKPAPSPKDTKAQDDKKAPPK